MSSSCFQYMFCFSYSISWSVVIKRHSVYKCIWKTPLTMIHFPKQSDIYVMFTVWTKKICMYCTAGGRHWSGSNQTVTLWLVKWDTFCAHYSSCFTNLFVTSPILRLNFSRFHVYCKSLAVCVVKRSFSVFFFVNFLCISEN